jgi:uncharacterized protein
MKMGPIGWIAFVLVVIGGLNWGIIGVSGGFDVVALLGGTISTIVYILVGLSAIFMIVKPLLKGKAAEAPAQM